MDLFELEQIVEPLLTWFWLPCKNTAVERRTDSISCVGIGDHAPTDQGRGGLSPIMRGFMNALPTVESTGSSAGRNASEAMGGRAWIL